MIGKLKKYALIASRVLKRPKTLQEIKTLSDPMLDCVLESLEKAARSGLSDEVTADFRRQELYARKLMQDDSLVNYEVFNNPQPKKVSSIYRKAASPPFWCRFYYHLIRELELTDCFEIGTNLGVSGGYIIEALKYENNSSYTTLEGIPDLCRIANQHFDAIKRNVRVSVVEGMYQDTFNQAVNGHRFDLVFVDGNHQEAPTLEYFEKLKPRLKSKAVMIFDDINWNKGMQKAWYKITNDPGVSHTLDLYKMGIVIFNGETKESGGNFALHVRF